MDNNNSLNHLAIIMDGNGRWALNQDLPRTAGHAAGELALSKTIDWAIKNELSWLTVYAFSTENWNRPKREVKALMTLLLSTIKKEIKELHKNNVKFSTIGDISILPESTVKGIKEGIKLTNDNVFEIMMNQND